MISLKHKTILITGASSGIGTATAKLLATQGANLILVARREKKLQMLAEEIQKTNLQCQILPVVLDITHKTAVLEAFDHLSTNWQTIDVLINNAGLALSLDKFQDANIDDFETVIETNLNGLLYMTKAVLPKMLARNQGFIVNLGSIAGLLAYAGGNVYCATKAAVHSFSAALKHDLLGTDIRVSEILPGMVETEFSMVRYKGDEIKAKKTYEGLTPLTAEDIADAILYCISRPPHVNISEMVLYPTAQAGSQIVHRRSQVLCPQD